MFKKLLAVVVVVLLGLVGFIASRPATFEIKRSLVINAPPDVVYAQVASFKSWAAWSPWDAMDPSMKRSYTGAESGVGAQYAWEGNDKVGTGEMKITDAKPGEHLGLDLHFITPFEANNRTDFDFEKTGEGTTVTWLMSGKNNFGAKAATLFMDMDKMVGRDFEKGLAAMKTAAEKAATDAAAAKKAAEAAAVAAPPADAAGDAGTP
jgi:Polyketide cyclase / dehydrase and lipid transport